VDYGCEKPLGSILLYQAQDSFVCAYRDGKAPHFRALVKSPLRLTVRFEGLLCIIGVQNVFAPFCVPKQNILIFWTHNRMKH
jgi:hypothetical protein